MWGCNYLCLFTLFLASMTMNSRQYPTVLFVTLSFFISPWRSPVDASTWTMMDNHICNVLYLKENPSDQPNLSLTIISIYNDMLCLHRQTRLLTWKSNLFSPSSFLFGFYTKIKNVLSRKTKKKNVTWPSEKDSWPCRLRRICQVCVGGTLNNIFIRQVVLSKSAYSSYKIM